MAHQSAEPAGSHGGAATSLTEFATRPALKYVGFALLLAWHYALWFVPHMFVQTELLDDRVTIAWLVNLGAAVVSLLLIALVLGRKRHLSSYRWLYAAAPILTCLATLAMCLPPQVFTVPGLLYALTFFTGIAESAMWILWGERYACVKANFSLRHIGTTFGLALLATIMIAWTLPVYVTTLFVALLPLASGALLVAARRDGSRAFPVLLPKSAAQGGLKNMVTVSVITFAASVACYFLVAIIPWQVLPTGDVTFTLGILGGAVIMLALAGISIVSKDKASIFKMFPWLLVLLIAAFALFLADQVAYLPAFIMATGISSLLEILLIMYFGILTSKGYVTPAVAFAFSGAFVRAGIAVGNTWAVGYELAPRPGVRHHPRNLPGAHVRAGRAARAARAPGVQHRGADGGPAVEGRDRRDLRRSGEGVRPVGTRSRDPRAHRARLHYEQHGRQAGDLALHGEHPHPPHLREDADPQAQRAAELPEHAAERFLEGASR